MFDLQEPFENSQPPRRKPGKALLFKPLDHLMAKPAPDLGLTEEPSFTLAETTRSLSVMQKRIGMLAGHMSQQLALHQKAMANTNGAFNQLLDDLEPVTDFFRQAFALRGVAADQIYCEVDPDRSVGVIRVLWHTISFTARGNTQPLALTRPGREPLFTGRILAIRGDFQEISLTWDPQHFYDLLPFELSSLYVPSDETDPAVMKIAHLGNEEHYFHQSEAPRLFLMKTMEMVCGGGFLHEQ